MNAERLHSLAKAIRDDIDTAGSLKLLEQMSQMLQNQINSPQDPSHQQGVSTAQTKLIAALEAAPSNSFPPTWKQTLEDLGGDWLLGLALRDRVMQIFAQNQITPAVARKEIVELHGVLNRFKKAIDELLSAFKTLGVESEELDPGTAELGVLIPRGFVDNKLEKLATELKEDDRIFGVFAELATGNRPGFEIHSLSSSDLSVFLGVDPATAACIALAVERIITVYKNLLEIRKLRNELGERGLTDEELKPIEQRAELMMSEGIESLIPALLNDFYKNTDVGRRNEMKIELRYSLSKIANRIDRGFNIEVRLKPVPEAKQSENADEKRYADIIERAAPTLEFLKGEGRPILSLKEREERPKSEPKAEPKKDKKS